MRRASSVARAQPRLAVDEVAGRERVVDHEHGGLRTARHLRALALARRERLRERDRDRERTRARARAAAARSRSRSWRAVRRFVAIRKSSAANFTTRARRRPIRWIAIGTAIATTPTSMSGARKPIYATNYAPRRRSRPSVPGAVEALRRQACGRGPAKAATRISTGSRRDRSRSRSAGRAAQVAPVRRQWAMPDARPRFHVSHAGTARFAGMACARSTSIATSASTPRLRSVPCPGHPAQSDSPGQAGHHRHALDFQNRLRAEGLGGVRLRGRWQRPAGGRRLRPPAARHRPRRDRALRRSRDARRSPHRPGSRRRRWRRGRSGG